MRRSSSWGDKVVEDISPVVILGRDSQKGTYILRIRLNKSRRVRFGKFKRGKLIGLPAGEYAYVGSALGEKGASSLAFRLLRHATRSGKKRAHGIRKEMVECFGTVDLGKADLLPQKAKKKHWNVDYLLDLPVVEIVQVFAVRSSRRLENAFARLLEKDPKTQIIEKGLGAGDAAGSTHLLRVEVEEEWWEELVERLKTIAALT